MDQENKTEIFAYTYSAKQQEEVQKIRQKYVTNQTSEEEDKMEQLRRLDAGVTKKGTVVSLIVGIISTLILGAGMSCCMVWGGSLFVPGIAIGLIGIGGVALAYPLYAHITKRERERIAPEILRLTEELLK
ncbi:MAG: hypothetical protein J6I64_04850 [Lachnospiraceae bacterium]|nr:hypothetical protein [Lachnospiraceae bacterium]